MRLTIDITDSMIHDTLKSSIASEIKSMNMEKIVSNIVETKLENLVRKSIADGSFVNTVAKKIASEISIEEITTLVDVNRLNDMISERVSKSLLNKMNLIK